MTYAEVVKFVRSVKYKPGWMFTVTSAPDVEPLLMRVRFEAPNCENPSEVISVGMPRQLHYADIDHDGLVEWFTETIRRCEDHEMREWLRIDGKKIDDPHADAEALEKLTL